MEPKVTLTDLPDRRAEKVIGEGLRRYNAEPAELRGRIYFTKSLAWGV